MTEFTLKILEADGCFFDGQVVSLIVPTSEGSYGIQAHHENMIAAVVPGIVKYTTPEGERLHAAIANGFMKIENNEVLILAEAAEKPEEIDEKRMLKEVEDAREEMLQKKSIEEYKIAQARMARAINRLKVKNKYGK